METKSEKYAQKSAKQQLSIYFSYICAEKLSFDTIRHRMTWKLQPMKTVGLQRQKLNNSKI